MKKIDEMKRYWAVVWVSAALFASSCSAGGEGASAGEGSVEFDCSVSTFVGTRAETRELPAELIPDAGALSLSLSGTDGVVASYETLADYDQPLLAEGNYTASFTYGDPEAEGAGAACFSGEEAFTIVARKTVTEPVSVSLANSVFTLVFSDWFRKYYSEFTVNIRTDSGFRAGFVGSASSPLPQTVPQFVKAGTGLYMSGSATKTNGVEVAFPETLVGTTAARTWHTVTVDAGQVGQAGIVVSLDDTPVAVEEIPVELNPDA